jgi:hypothetical protein
VQGSYYNAVPVAAKFHTSATLERLG